MAMGGFGEGGRGMVVLNSTLSVDDLYRIQRSLWMVLYRIRALSVNDLYRIQRSLRITCTRPPWRVSSWSWERHFVATEGSDGDSGGVMQSVALSVDQLSTTTMAPEFLKLVTATERLNRIVEVCSSPSTSTQRHNSHFVKRAFAVSFE